MTHTRNQFIASGIEALDQHIDLLIDNLRAAEYDSEDWHKGVPHCGGKAF